MTLVTTGYVDLENARAYMPPIINLIRYFVIAGSAFLVFYKLFPNKFQHLKIQKRNARKKDFRREIWNSIQSSAVIGLFIVVFLVTPLREYSKIYDAFSQHTLFYIPVSICLAMIIHDTYFYWMHRIIHHPSLFKMVHLVHHKSTNPSPLASLSFHFFEAILEALAVPFIICIIPMHTSSLIVFGLISFVFNVYGHLGYEIAPKWLRHTFLFNILSTSTYHNLHHEKFKSNYGLYFRWWDRIMNTENPNYSAVYDNIQNKKRLKNV